MRESIRDELEKLRGSRCLVSDLWIMTSFYYSTTTFIPTNRFQTEAAAKFGVIFFLWNVVSKVLHLQEINANSTGSKEAIDFLASHQNFSITEFVKKHGFYLNNSTLLDCDFFGKPCGPQVMILIFLQISSI